MKKIVLQLNSFIQKNDDTIHKDWKITFNQLPNHNMYKQYCSKITKTIPAAGTIIIQYNKTAMSLKREDNLQNHENSI